MTLSLPTVANSSFKAMALLPLKSNFRTLPYYELFMSLSIEWFAASDQRNKMRDANGVSIEEAEGDLAFNSSSAYPVAEETARWIYKNWSLEKIFQLSPHARQTLLRIIEDQLKNSTQEQT